MGHHHGHSHGHPGEKSDFWTKLGAVGEFAQGYVGSAFWVAKLIDITFDPKKTVLPVSFWGLGVGMVVAAFLAAGATYSHYVVNLNHQDNHHVSISDERAPLVTHSTKLSAFQWIALALDFSQHAAGFAGTASLAAETFAGDHLARWEDAVVQLGAGLFGTLFSVANVRTCYRNMKTSAQPSEQAIPLDGRYGFY